MSQPSLCLPFFSLSCSGLHLSLNGQSGTGSCLGPCGRTGGREEVGCIDFNEMRSINGHSLWRGQEEKGALSLSFSAVPSSLCPLPSAPSLPLLPSSPAGEGLCLGARWYPRCPSSADPFSYIHQPPLRSEVTTGHLNGSPWQQWPWRLREWQRLFVVDCCCRGQCLMNLFLLHRENWSTIRDKHQSISKNSAKTNYLFIWKSAYCIKKYYIVLYKIQCNNRTSFKKMWSVAVLSLM